VYIQLPLKRREIRQIEQNTPSNYDAERSYFDFELVHGRINTEIIETRKRTHSQIQNIPTVLGSYF
tara:strand:- start:278 stop:475 length:198 start_codon:yes stop_codon:yes gene_type:complete